MQIYVFLIPSGSEEGGVLTVGSIPVAILPSCQNFKTIALYLHKHEHSWVLKIRNTSDAVVSPQYTHNTDRGTMGLGQYNSLMEYCGPHTASSVFLILVYRQIITDISRCSITFVTSINHSSEEDK